jgi:hypothetical protein
MVGDHLDPNANAATLMMSILCIAALLIMKRWQRRVSGPIIVVALTILAMRLWDLRNDGIALINPGLPLPALPTSAGALGSEDLIAPALGVWYLSHYFARSSEQHIRHCGRSEPMR